MDEQQDNRPEAQASAAHNGNASLGKRAWDAYREAVGGLSFQGDPLPEWSGLGERQRIGWRAAAEAVARHVAAHPEQVS